MLIKNEQSIEQGAITAFVTLIVAAVGIAVFNIDTAIYSGIVSGLSVTIGKEYGDSLIINNKWHWKDIIPGIIGVAVGLLACAILFVIL